MPCNSQAVVQIRLSADVYATLYASPQAHTALARWLAGKLGAANSTATASPASVLINAAGHSLTLSARSAILRGAMAPQLQAQLQQTAELLAIALKQNELAEAAKRLSTVLSDGTPADPKLAAQGVRQLVIAL